MDRATKLDQERSSSALVNIIWPAISGMLGGGEIKLVEGVQQDLAVLIDIGAGVDAWQVTEQGKIRPIGNRVQWVKRPFRTHTIRYSRPSGVKTEWEKLIESIDGINQGYARPFITIQSYLEAETSRFLCSGVVYTLDLVMYARKHETDDPSLRTCWMQTNRSDGVKFLVVSWSAMQRDGIRMMIREAQDNLPLTSN